MIRFITLGLLGKGYGPATRIMQKILGDRNAYVQFKDGSKFNFDILDSYWNKLLIKDFLYEPELHAIFHYLKDIDFTFIDAGANAGYWSVLMSSQMYGNRDTIAIEASAKTFKKLELNNKVNNNRFVIHHNAIFNKSDVVLNFSTGAHAGRHIIDTQKKNSDTVKSITLNQIVRHHKIPNNQSIVIKLDVEGAEIPGIEGAQNLMGAFNILFVYEDHGKEITHEVTKFVLNNGYEVFFMQDDGYMYKILEPKQLDKIKIDPRKGYNFLACIKKSDFYELLNRYCKQSDKAP